MAQENTGLRIQRGSPGARLSIGHWLWARHPTSSLTVLLFDPLSYRNVTNRRMSRQAFNKYVLQWVSIVLGFDTHFDIALLWAHSKAAPSEFGDKT